MILANKSGAVEENAGDRIENVGNRLKVRTRTSMLQDL